MADAAEPTGPPDSRQRGLLAAVRERAARVGLVEVVVAIAVLAILARLVFLGARTAHYDEGRVAYWVLHAIESDAFVYRRIIHGPFIQHVLGRLFPLLGTTDFVMRLPIAVVGGLLPLAALLFRAHLRDEEVVVFALFLAFNAVLLYYSRFMRSDLLVAAFSLAALGCLLRLYDTQRVGYLYVGVGLLALAFASKENAVIYVLTWVGATGLVVGHEFLRWIGLRRVWRSLASERLAALRRGIRAIPGTLWAALVVGYRSARRGLRTHDRGARGWVLHAVGAAALFVGITVAMYGLRGDVTDIWFQGPTRAPWTHLTVNLGEATSNPLSMPRYVYETLGYTTEQYVEWFGPAGETGSGDVSILEEWLDYLWQYVEVMFENAIVLGLFAVLGFLYELFSGGRARNLVLFSAYAGFASVLGYPLGTDIFGAWLVVHALVPLAIPAAVGVAVIYRWGREAADAGDRPAAAIAAVVLVLLAAQVAVVNVGSVYSNDAAGENTLVQFAQPVDDLDPVVGAIERAAAESRVGPDVVLYYGATNEDREDRDILVKTGQGWSQGELLTYPACAEWWNTLPLPWYWTRSDANVTCDRQASALVDRATSGQPGVVIAASSDPTVPNQELIEAGYQRQYVGIRSYGRTLSVFVHDRLAD